jgi:hypothetical protein
VDSNVIACMLDCAEHVSAGRDHATRGDVGDDGHRHSAGAVLGDDYPRVFSPAAKGPTPTCASRRWRWQCVLQTAVSKSCVADHTTFLEVSRKQSCSVRCACCLCVKVAGVGSVHGVWRG